MRAELRNTSAVIPGWCASAQIAAFVEGGADMVTAYTLSNLRRVFLRRCGCWVAVAAPIMVMSLRFAWHACRRLR